MTVSEIRSLMLEKVIPESLLPQNIAVCLMDENAAPPELDAFTFLNRLRSLGIGLENRAAPGYEPANAHRHAGKLRAYAEGLHPYAIHGASALGAHHNHAYRLRRTGSGG